MVLEYDWTYDPCRSRLGDPFPSTEHSFETLPAALHTLRLVRLRLGAKTIRAHGVLSSWNLSPSAPGPALPRSVSVPPEGGSRGRSFRRIGCRRRNLIRISWNA
jgi:hypothetical protein